MPEKKKDTPVVIVEKDSGSSVGGFLVGLLTGAVAGLLLAPKSGEETQQEIREGALKLRVDAENKLADLREELTDIYERAREDVSERMDAARDEINERRRRAEEAVRAGRTAASSARTDLERRVEESKQAYKEAVGAESGGGEGGDEAEEA